MPKKTQAEQRGYLLPETINPEQVSICICIPCDKNHALAFLGQLNDLGYWWNWERDPLHKGTEAARVWRDIFDDVNQQLNDCGVFDMGCGCDEKLIESQYIGEDGHLHVVYNDGTEEIRDDLDPRFSNPILPPMSGSDGDTKKCVAANSAVTAIKELQENELAALEDGTSLIQTLFTILAGLIGVIIGLPIVGIPAFLVLLMYAVVNFIARQIPAEFEAAFTEETWQELLCLLFCNMSDDGSFTEAQFEAVRASIDPAITGAVAIEFFQRHFDVFGPVGLTNMARSGYGGSRECDACSCGEWCYYFDFAIDGQGFTPEWGFYNTGCCWEGVDLGGGNISLYAKIAAVGHLTKIEAFYSFGVKGDCDFFVDGVSVGGVLDQFSGVKTWNVDLDFAEVGFNPSSGASYGAGNSVECLWLRLTGTGENPFGENNCEE